MKWPFELGVIVSVLTLVLCVIGTQLHDVSKYGCMMQTRTAIERGVINVPAYNSWMHATGNATVDIPSPDAVPMVSLKSAEIVSSTFTAFFGLNRYAFYAIGFLALIQGCICIIALFKSRATTPTP